MEAYIIKTIISAMMNPRIFPSLPFALLLGLALVPATAEAAQGPSVSRKDSPARGFRLFAKKEAGDSVRKTTSRRSAVQAPKKAGWFSGNQSARAAKQQSARPAVTYPIIEQRGQTTVVKVNPVQTPATIRHDVLQRGDRSRTRVVVDLSAQRAYLLVDGQVGIETPVSTARSGKFTPTGTYTITERVRSGKISTIYDVAMPNWMRLGGTVFGLHAGYLPGYPASAGCVRLPSPVAPYIFDYTRSGTPVAIYRSWGGA